MAGQERRQLFVQRGIHQAVDAALGDARQRRQRDRQEIQLERQRLAVEIAAGENLLAEHQRIVGGRVQLDREHAARLGQRVAHRAVDLRRAAQRVGVLHAPAGDVRLPDLAAFEQVAQTRGALQLAGMRARRVNPLVEGARRAAQRVERHGADHVGRIRPGSRAASSSRQPMASIACVPLIRLMPSLGCRSIGSMPARAQRLAARQDRAFEFRLAFADQHQRHVGQRREIARRAHAALRRHDRRDAAIQQIAEALGDQRPDAGESLGQHVGADQHHGADHVARQRIADAGGMRADHVALQLVEILARNADVGQQPDAGVDRVDRSVARRPAGRSATRDALHPRDGVGGEGDVGTCARAPRDADVGDGQSDCRRVEAAQSSVPLLAGRDQLFDVDQLGRIVAGVAGVAVFVRSSSPTALRSDAEREIAERIGFDEAADLFDGVVGGDQLALVRRVDAVEAGRNRRRAGDAQMHFARAGLPHHADDLAAGGAADDGIVHQHHALAFAADGAPGLSFSLTPKSRMACEGSMNVRPT